MLINRSAFLALALGHRVVHLAGPLGKGKTSLAFKLGQELMETGRFRYLVANCRSIWNDDPRTVQLEESYLDAVIILDEAGIFMSDNKAVAPYLSYARKLNSVVIVSSAEPPPGRVRAVSVERVFDGGVYGLPLWWYKAREKSFKGYHEYGFGWWRPSEVWGIYDTYDFPASDRGITDMMQRILDEVTAGEWSEKQQLREMENGGWELAAALTGLDEVQEAISVHSDIISKITKRRRR